tara:strand:+ start:458 stop:1189 length:732 start_codon:yes stop_codon:yes gene_type:complete
MIITSRIILLFLLYSFLFSDENKEDYYIRKTNEKFNEVNDYQVEMVIRVKVPAFRMPKKKYKVFYKKPNKIKIKSKGFGILPKTGLFTSPNDNFDNLKNITMIYDEDLSNHVVLKGDLIVDSLKFDMPNEYSRITFDPIVEVKIDTINWVIKNVTTKLDSLKLFQINNNYDTYNDKYYMPKESVVKYFIKDKKLFNWINKDASNVIGQGKELANRNDSIVEGTITVEYNNYKINKGIKDKIFD